MNKTINILLFCIAVIFIAAVAGCGSDKIEVSSHLWNPLYHRKIHVSKFSLKTQEVWTDICVMVHS